jgi:hypothetical protein
MAGTRSLRRSQLAWLAGLALAIGGGIWLRLDQLGSQLLLEDEWHAVYRVVHETPAAVFLDFADSDSSIPLTLLYLGESSAFGLSELAMRLPLIAAGIATLVLFPWYVARRFGRAEALLFALLLAISPLLYFFSRTARPYALTLLLVWVAHVAFRHYVERADRRRHRELGLYATAASLGAWLHPVVVPFVVAPFFTAAWRALQNSEAGARKVALFRLALPALAAGVPMIVLLLPPLLAHPESLSHKSGIDLPRIDTLIGVWYHWFGTGSTTAVLTCAALALVGAPTVWRRLPEAGSMLAGAALYALMIVVTQPAWVSNSLTLARYMLPALPLLLLATVCGALRLGRALRAGIRERGGGIVVTTAAGAAAAALPLAALAATTPLWPVLARPNGNSLHALYEFDFRPTHNPILALMDGIPLSPWWARLAEHPPGSIAIAVAPFPTESVGWDAPRWQRLSRQRVLSGFLTPLCANPRANEVPDDPRFAFRNAVHLGDVAELAAQRVDFVVWQKPYRYVAHGLDVPIGSDVAQCGGALAAHFGAPVYEDAWLAVYAARNPESGARGGSR